ncbi:uncharacterized protein BO97DRAFT_431122 [Aspergillus homomorphus CBS 101889]|uniref:Uncharacterized protein n=1 Tax=Aspergillus homomorphus (strain CBS 101889) TaxID=1450537 RepID=A0A395ID87_ASPHC|nr:hypothetical protein BO97DRAFT_431122 [Aspergillus homomorphus CBS 101889]RAL17123.1 hypothetical protein BO97DRAFT_431122 [Aspergillus homomorphus CBS 101889]
MAHIYSTTTVTPVSTRTSNFPVLRIMSGKCHFLVPVGTLTICCPCTGFTGTSTDGQLDILCQACLHPLTQHGDVISAEVYSTQQGSSQLEISVPLDPFISPPSETVSKLVDLIDSEKVVHVRGTPASGKTTLAQSLQRYYQVKKRNSIYVDIWRELDEYPSVIDDPLFRPWSKLNIMLRTRFGSNMNYLASGTILIIHEAQSSYSDTLFWNSIIKNRLSHQGPDIRFSQRVTLTPQSHPSSPSIGLFFSRSEFTDAAQRLIANSRFQEKFTLRPDAEDYLFSLTNGHPGGLALLKWDRKVWETLAQEPISRSLPQSNFLTTEVANLLAKVLEEGNVLCGPKRNEEVETCYRRGWLHRMQILGEDGLDKDVYVLPSRLHEKHVSLSIHSRYLDCIILTIPRWIEHYIGKIARSLPSEFQNLRDLTIAILRGFSSSSLRQSAQGKKLSSGAQPKPVEAQYQDEFYRCFNKLAGRGVPVCTEWSRTTDGRVDFWIPGKKWAVEIVREQDRINEHIMRFHENGQYYPWREDGMIEDWIIVNCTTSPPTRDLFFAQLRIRCFIWDGRKVYGINFEAIQKRLEAPKSVQGLYLPL